MSDSPSNSMSNCDNDEYLKDPNMSQLMWTWGSELDKGNTPEICWGDPPPSTPSPARTEHAADATVNDTTWQAIDRDGVTNKHDDQPLQSWDSLPVPGFPPTLADDDPYWNYHWNPDCTNRQIYNLLECYDMWLVGRDRSRRWNARKRLALALQVDRLADIHDEDCPLEAIADLFGDDQIAQASS